MSSTNKESETDKKADTSEQEEIGETSGGSSNIIPDSMPAVEFVQGDGRSATKTTNEIVV